MMDHIMKENFKEIHLIVIILYIIDIGTFYWNDGRKYIGEWRDGVKEG